MMIWLWIVGIWFAILVAFALILIFAPKPVGLSLDCRDGVHEWEWDGTLGGGNDAVRYIKPWKCKHCSERAGSKGAGGFGP